ncbi:heat shock 70 kDa protein-like [Yasminevirus sp. GU-2018]|uniref:Heat shock 70 kDa protein-like n=1 Tax=Yasminevirus sp. GU-2018 TaxID=2420051 RepID=A0A5K0U971_9VIRU|nr:heat shock 70 kDa protein-like [Yasminevirus sp. GU-2018]
MSVETDPISSNEAILKLIDSTSETVKFVKSESIDTKDNTRNNTGHNVEVEDDSDTDSVMDYIDTGDKSLLNKTEEEIEAEKNKNYPIVLGIDLGTTNSCISIWRNNTCEIIPDEYGNRTIPSYVSLTNISKYVGHEAKRQKDINAENVFYEVKRLIGRTYNEKAVQDCLKFLSYNVVPNDRGCVSLKSTVRNGKEFTPEEISAAVLMKLKDMAQKYLKREVKDVVITVPAHFNDSQRQATKDAATIAGLNCLRMFHEPTAAALAYGMMDRSINKALNTKSTSNKTKVSKKSDNHSDDETDNESEDETDNGTDGESEDDNVKKDSDNESNNESDSDTEKMSYDDKNKQTNNVQVPENVADSDEKEEDPKGMTILVYDFGGGTLDVSLIDVFDGVFDVLGSSGISQLGGVDFDNRLINFCIAAFSRHNYRAGEKIDTDKLSRLSLQRLRTQCESAKKILSTNVSAIVAIEDFHDGKDMFVKINRTDFENLCRDLFLLCLYPVDELLNECGKTENDVDEVILVGGMTRMPHIREMLNNRFRRSDGTSKVNCSINPDEAVSVGAALQGYILANRDDPFSDSVTLMDVTPLSLGVEVIGGVMDILIKRNTMIPCEKTKLYSTDTDYVDSVLIKIFEGERTMTSQNFKIGEFELDKIPVEQRGMPEIEISFAIDINGIVTVTAIEKDVNEKKSIIVNTNKNGLKPHQLQALIDEALEQETMDEIDRVKKFSYYEMEDLCANVLTNIKNKEFKLTERDIKEINEDITLILAWLKEKSYRDRDIEEFEEATQKMKKKYGVLILHGKLEDNKVKGNADQMEATTLYGKDDDEEEEEMKQAFEKVKKDEMGVEGMSDAEVIEIKDMRDALMDLCKTVCGIVSSGKMNIDADHKREVLNHIDDAMMWYYSHEKPTKMDYKEKIDSINAMCDELVNRYESSGKDLFSKGELEKDTDTKAQKLEKLCLTLITMIENNQLSGSKASLALLKTKLKKILKFVYTQDENDSYQPVITGTDADNKPPVDNSAEEAFQAKCEEYIKEVNSICDNIYNNLQGISMRGGPVVTLSRQPVDNKDKIVTSDIKVDQDKPLDESGHRKGMSVLELMRIKQNEEMEEAIDRQINPQDYEDSEADLGDNTEDKNKDDTSFNKVDKHKLFIVA